MYMYIICILMGFESLGFINRFKDLCVVTVYTCTCLKIYLYKKALFIFVNNVTFFSMLYFSVTSGLKSSDPFFLAF